jgi:competence protein ComEA
VKPWLWFLYGLAIGILSSGVLYLLIAPPQGGKIELLPLPTQSPYRIDISGQVHEPGVYSLAKGNRWEDVVFLAGGLKEDADINSINLAKKIYDGEKIYIPAIGESIIPSPRRSPSDTTIISPEYPLDINSATKEQLELLPGIGPKIAEEIIKYRDIHGLFNSPEELKEVTGIGEEIFNSISGIIIIY